MLRISTAVIAASACVSAANAATIINDNTIQSDIPGIANFTTTGAMMTGMGVTANFSSGFSQTLAWAPTGANSGGVSGAGWGLSQTGDTFAGLWTFSIANANLGQLTGFSLTGNAGLVLFDTSLPAPGTPDSANGSRSTLARVRGPTSCSGRTRTTTSASPRCPNRPPSLFSALA